MKTLKFLLVLITGSTAFLINPHFFSALVDEPTLVTRQNLPLRATYGRPGPDVLGEDDVLAVDPGDPILREVSGKKSSLTALPASLVADGTTATTVVVTVRTEDGTLVSGAQVNLESNRGQQDTIEVVRGISGPDGQAIFLVRSLEAGSLILTAHVGTKLVDQKATVKFTEPVTAAFNTRLVWAGLGAIILLILFQYLFARLVLSARSRQEEELFFHHPQVLKTK